MAAVNTPLETGFFPVLLAVARGAEDLRICLWETARGGLGPADATGQCYHRPSGGREEIMKLAIQAIVASGVLALAGLARADALAPSKQAIIADVIYGHKDGM